MSAFRWMSLCLLSLAALVGVASAVVLVAVGRETRENIIALIRGPYPDGRSSSWHTPAGEELIRANNDHFNIAFEISKCFGDVDLAYDVSGPPASVAIAFRLGMQPNGEQAWDKRIPGDVAVKLTNYQRHILIVSQSITAARAQLANAVAKNSFNSLTLHWAITIVGALTTIFVSIKSMTTGTGSRQFAVGVLAVIFSALGTALASINSFTSPNDTALRAERFLNQLRHAQLDLAFLVSQSKDICSDINFDRLDDANVKKLNDITSRVKESFALSTIVSSSQAGPAGISSSSTSSIGR